MHNYYANFVWCIPKFVAVYDRSACVPERLTDFSHMYDMDEYSSM